MIKISRIKKEIIIVEDKNKKSVNFIQDEILVFESGAQGIVLLANQNKAIVGLLSDVKTFSVTVGMKAKKTNEKFKIYPSKSFLGMIVDYMGVPIKPIKDGNKSIGKKGKVGVDVDVNNVKLIDRDHVSEDFMSGLFGLDVFIPFGKGQRELVIGDKNTGKTTISLSFIKQNYDDPNQIFIYNAIGKTKDEVFTVVDYLNKNNLTEKTIIVASFIENSEIAQYYSPYLSTSIAEYFRIKHKINSFIIYDDLMKQADAYRSLCIQMNITPGRESFPGDIFYAHSRLLERSGKFKDGTSISSICICETIEEDSSAYIPTNIISITDGQIVTSKNKFNLNIFPSIDYAKSVSRVGRSAQTEVVKDAQKDLQFLLANFETTEDKMFFEESVSSSGQSDAYKGFILSTILHQDSNIKFTSKETLFLSLLIKDDIVKLITDKKEMSEAILFLLNKVRNDKKMKKLFKAIDDNTGDKLYGFKKIMKIEMKKYLSWWLRVKYQDKPTKYNKIVEIYRGFNFYKEKESEGNENG